MTWKPDLHIWTGDRMMLSLLLTAVSGKQKLSIQSKGYALKKVVRGWGETNWALHLMVSPTPPHPFSVRILLQCK